MNKLFAVAALTLLTAPAWAGDSTITLSVPTMDCPVCPITVKKALTKVAGVIRAEVHLDKRVAIVTFDDARTDVDALMRATRDAGYPSTVGSAK